MQDFIVVTGMVIGAFPSGEYDKRLTLLTKESGKITVFVKGARKSQSRFCAASDLFVFGTFELYVGKSAYNLHNVTVLNYFDYLRTDMDAAYFGMYFLELCDFYSRENNDEALLLLTLYRALQGLKSDKLKNSFVKTVFEIKTFILEGEFIPPERFGEFRSEVYTAVKYITETPIEKLFSFSLTNEGLAELTSLADKERKSLVDRNLKSLEILNVMVSEKSGI